MTRMAPRIEIVVLGLLTGGPAHGYGLVERMRRRSMDRWVDVGRASIYQALARLELAGLITGRTEDGPEGPDRRVFRITKAGRARLRRGVRDHLRSQGPYATGAGAALGFLGALPADELGAALDDRERALSSLLSTLAEPPEEAIDGSAGGIVTRALVARQQALAQAELTWLREHRRSLARALEDGAQRADG